MSKAPHVANIRFGYIAYLIVVVLAAAVLSVRVAHAQTCKYTDCWADGYPTPPCGDCGTWTEWVSFNKTTNCFQCGSGKCHVYEEFGSYYYGYYCLECRNWTYIEQCFSS
jgi:hypothetical protein